MLYDWRAEPGRYLKDPRLGHRLGRNHPGGELTDDMWKLHALGTDADGFAHNGSPNRDYRLNDRTFDRTFLLGGSTLLGLGVTNDRTISSELERILRRTNETSRTLNCGCGAYQSWQEAVYFVTELVLHKPNTVVVLDGWNDFAHSSWGNKRADGAWLPNTGRSLDDVVDLMRAAAGGMTVREFLRRKFDSLPLLNDLRFRGQHAARAGVWSDSDYRKWHVKQEGIDCYITNLRSVIGAARANGAKVLTFFQPQILWGQRKPTDHERTMIEAIGKRQPPFVTLAPEWFERTRAAYAELRADLHDGQSVWIEDASSWLDTVEETVYHDYNHYNVLGNRLIAEQIASRIQEMRRSEPLAHAS